MPKTKTPKKTPAQIAEEMAAEARETDGLEPEAVTSPDQVEGTWMVTKKFSRCFCNHDGSFEVVPVKTSLTVTLHRPPKSISRSGRLSDPLYLVKTGDKTVEILSEGRLREYATKEEGLL